MCHRKLRSIRRVQAVIFLSYFQRLLTWPVATLTCILVHTLILTGASDVVVFCESRRRIVERFRALGVVYKLMILSASYPVCETTAIYCCFATFETKARETDTLTAEFLSERQRVI